MILLYILRKRVPIIREHIVYYIERRGWAARPDNHERYLIEIWAREAPPFDVRGLPW